MEPTDLHIDALYEQATHSLDFPEPPLVSSQLFLIRHGERADQATFLDIKYDTAYDPPLTPLGMTQA